MLQTFRLLGQLSPAERDTIVSGQFAGDFTPDALLDQMRTLATFDASNDKTRGRFAGLIGICVVATIAALIMHNIAPLVLYPVAALSGIAAIALFIMRRRLVKVDISNNFREVALPFLALIKQDMDADQTVTVRIDLRSPTDPKKRRGTSQPYQQGAYTKIVDTTYSDAWFHGAAQLADGSKLRWDVTDEVCESQRTKRSRSNKSKTKTRHLKRSTIAVALSVANKVYGVNKGLASSRHKVAVQEGAKRRTIKLTRKLKNKSLDPIDPAVLVDAVSSAYKRVAAPARSVA
jgi:hypothetical protein